MVAITILKLVMNMMSRDSEGDLAVFKERSSLLTSVQKAQYSTGT